MKQSQFVFWLCLFLLPTSVVSLAQSGRRLPPPPARTPDKADEMVHRAHKPPVPTAPAPKPKISLVLMQKPSDFSRVSNVDYDGIYNEIYRLLLADTRLNVVLGDRNIEDAYAQSHAHSTKQYVLWMYLEALPQDEESANTSEPQALRLNVRFYDRLGVTLLAEPYLFTEGVFAVSQSVTFQIYRLLSIPDPREPRPRICNWLGQCK